MQVSPPKTNLAFNCTKYDWTFLQTQMPRTLTLLVFMLPIPLLVIPFLGNTKGQAPMNDRHSTIEMDSDLRRLFDQKVGGPSFFKSLREIAKKRSWEPELAKWEKNTGSCWDNGRAISIDLAKSKFVIVLWKSWLHQIPGRDHQIALLLDNQGRYLDSLSCSVTARLSRNGLGNLNVAIAPKGEQDGAQLIIRLDGEQVRGKHHHYIDHGKESLDFDWLENKLPENQPNEWEVKGLCRIAIKDNKFDILFPITRQNSDKGQK